MSHKIKFQINEASQGRVWLDGKEIDVTEISYQAKGGNTLAIVTLKMIAEVDGEIEIRELTNRPDDGIRMDIVGQKDPVYFKGRD
ncbi:hypothetical protein [Bradyrhizobium elkanii]|uniref:hypothetical protein n=1 Tax=Bradyrhizobium elkanii TaxID=29448 RepID=UPI0022260D55|nr:hypothetical protein [Bradyrhizobium elkanii]MCW2228109.1 hypothetical protein [Bradyrhizobium elkanii]